MRAPLVVSLPDDRLVEPLAALPDPLPDGAVEWERWNLEGPAPRDRFDIVVLPYLGLVGRLGRLAEVEARLLQSQSIGYDGVAGVLPPGFVFANAATVHETSTAELALALTLASLRAVPEFVRDAQAGRWQSRFRPSLADSTVLLLGYGGVNQAVERRLAGFEVARVIRVASTARETPAGHVHGIDELTALLPQADVVIVGTPLTDATRGLLGRDELALLPDGALVVNVARGPVVRSEAILAETGRLLFGLDVTDPEPLPADHPLWHAPGVLISPHVGGATGAMEPRMAALLRRQIGHLLAGEEPENVVLRS